MPQHPPQSYRGTSLTEFILLVVLISAILISAVAFFSSELIHDYGDIAPSAFERIEP